MKEHRQKTTKICRTFERLVIVMRINKQQFKQPPTQRICTHLLSIQFLAMMSANLTITDPLAAMSLAVVMRLSLSCMIWHSIGKIKQNMHVSLWGLQRCSQFLHLTESLYSLYKDLLVAGKFYWMSNYCSTLYLHVVQVKFMFHKSDFFFFFL